MRRRALLLALVSAFAGTGAACGGNDGGSGNATNPGLNQEPVKTGPATGTTTEDRGTSTDDDDGGGGNYGNGG